MSRSNVTFSTRRIHLSVNSAGCNGRTGVIVNELFDLWSLPWHSLQRTLARGLVQTVGARSGAAGPAASSHSNGTPATWLARARGVDALAASCHRTAL